MQERPYQRNRFVKRYTATDSELLAAVDEAHSTLSGPATQKIRYREFHHYGDQRYARLASSSIAHIYNLRESRAYRERYISYPKTRTVQVAIAERRRPDPPGDSPVIYAWTRCIKETRKVLRARTTSTPSMRSRNERWWGSRRRLATPG